jgi:hypothetical protein
MESDGRTVGSAISDEDLAELALASDLDAPLDDDAVSIFDVIGAPSPGPLPAWYMPSPMRRGQVIGWRRHLLSAGAISVIASFLTITGAGLCNTYGQLHF